jgi:hypothetical protein
MTLQLNSEKIRRNLLHTLVRDGIHTKEELDFYIQEYLGYNIPKKRSCPNHISPFRFLYDAFFERIGNAFAYGSRGSGKTRIFSLLNHLDMLFKPGCTITSAGATLDQSHRCYDYFCEYYKNPMLKPLLVSNLMSYSEGANGSSLEVITGSLKGFNGPHPVKARIDELELIKWEILQEGLSMALSDGQYRPQTIMASTRKWAGGSVARILDEAVSRGVKVYNFCALEVLQTCQRECFGDKEHGDCFAYQYQSKDGDYVPLCYGAAHNSDGWMPIEDFLDKIALIDRDVILSQWLNRRASDSSLVYGSFWNPDVHIINWERFKYLTGHDRPPPQWKRYAGLDLGSRFAYVKAAIDPHGTWYVYYEYYHDGNTEGVRLLKEHADIIRDSPDFGLETGTFYDPSGLQESLELGSYGIPMTPADNDVTLGIGEVRRLLQRDSRTGRPNIYFLEDCEESLYEFELYAHPTGTDGFPSKDDVIKEYDHVLDACRYMIFSPKAQQGQVSTKRASGLW